MNPNPRRNDKIQQISGTKTQKHHQYVDRAAAKIRLREVTDHP
jgi:hypothetical protein